MKVPEIQPTESPNNNDALWNDPKTPLVFQAVRNDPEDGGKIAVSVTIGPFPQDLRIRAGDLLTIWHDGVWAVRYARKARAIPAFQDEEPEPLSENLFDELLLRAAAHFYPDIYIDLSHKIKDMINEMHKRFANEKEKEDQTYSSSTSEPVPTATESIPKPAKEKRIQGQNVS